MRFPLTIRGTTAISLVLGTAGFFAVSLGGELALPTSLRFVIAAIAVLACIAAGWTLTHTTRIATRRCAERLGASDASGLLPAVERTLERIRDLEDQLATQRATPWHQRTEAEVLFEAFGEATLLIGEDGTILLANERARRLLGVSQPLHDRHVSEVLTKAELLEEIASARRGVGGQSTIRLPQAETTRICKTTTQPIATQTPPSPVLVTMRDVTELAGALQLKTDFVANASHELRTPISSIRAAADTLEAAGGDAEMRARLIGMIQNHSVRLDELIRDLLDLSKLESQDAPVAIRPVRMSDIAAELTEMLDEVCTSNQVRLEFDIHPALEEIRTDHRLLMLILKNLAENAAKFARPETSVRVIAKPNPTPDEPLDAMELRIVDAGQGIPLSQQPRIFERFYQVDSARTGSARRGTGLGLSIVKHAIKLLDGSLGVESVWGQGTTMIVALPACIARQAAPAS
ncbi:MAG: ATP-binding protein [Planctomycetota bacterium]